MIRSQVGREKCNKKRMRTYCDLNREAKWLSNEVVSAISGGPSWKYVF